MSKWNERRGELIQKKVYSTLTDGEARELERLQKRADKMVSKRVKPQIEKLEAYMREHNISIDGEKL